MKHILKFTLPALALCAAVACSKTAVEPVNPNAGKELIAFSQEGSALTKAALTKAGFEKDTKIVVRIKAVNSGTNAVRYSQAIATAQAETTADDACNTEFKLEGTHSHLKYLSNQHRYWDDAFGRNSQLTVYAVAVPDQDDATIIPDNILSVNGTAQTVVDANTNPNWYTITGDENTLIDWQVSTKQTKDTRVKEDLTYSNNIRYDEPKYKGRYHQKWDNEKSDWVKSMELGFLSWQEKASGSTAGKFDQGHLVFKHALAWITLVLKEGEGFDGTSNLDFKWTNTPAGYSQTLTLKKFNTVGKLDVSTGAWSDLGSVDIQQLDDVSPANAAAQTVHTLHGYVLPGNKLYGDNDNVIEFELDNAQYYVTGNQIAEAIRKYAVNNSQSYTDFETIEAGKHYLINLTVGKKGVDNLTAALLPWEEVNSDDAVAKNTYAEFTFADKNEKLDNSKADQFDVYRAGIEIDDYITGSTQSNYAWSTGYATTPASKEYVTDHWKTDWYWENNKTYYHFRAAGIGETGTGSVTIDTDSVNGDSFAIASGIVGGSGSAYNDYVWGAPFVPLGDGEKFVYSEENGFSLKKDGATEQISGAICATDSQINMVLFHMTSQVKVNLTTTTDESKVVLDNGSTATTVEIVNFLPNGKVLMGTGAVSTTGSTRTEAAAMAQGTYTAEEGSKAAKVENYKYGIVPQELSWTGGSVGLRITTPDGNKYYVSDLSACTGTVSSNNLENPYSTNKITKWLPHYTYTYNITISKKAVENITAAVLPWEDVVSDNIPIDLEN